MDLINLPNMDGSPNHDTGLARLSHSLPFPAAEFSPVFRWRAIPRWKHGLFPVSRRMGPRRDARRQ
jgi:hypothetical protein